MILHPQSQKMKIEFGVYQPPIWSIWLWMHKFQSNTKKSMFVREGLKKYEI